MLQLKFQTQRNQIYVIYHKLSNQFCDKSQMTIILSEIGLKIKEIRESKGLSLQEVCDLAEGMSHTTLSKIENGINNPSKRTRIALAKALNNNFGDPNLDKYLVDNKSAPSKKEIIENTSIEEIFTLKFGNKNTKRTREEIVKLRKMVDRKIELMLDEN